jgi:glycosyltransferase involved in cell wall biosynthesis
VSERPSAPRRVLLVSRELPPAVGPHPIRVGKLAKYLPAFGWQPTILTVPVDHAWATDDTLLADLEGVDVVRVPRLLSRVAPPTRINRGDTLATPNRSSPRERRRTGPARRLLLPDRDILWAIPAARRGASLADQFDAVMTTAPPFSTHLVGYWLSERHHLPWVAEYRDNWSMNPLYRRGSVGQWINRATETRFLARADAIVTVSEAAAAEIAQSFPSTVGKLHPAANGFDPDDLPSAASLSASFEIAYAGTLHEARDPRPFFEALRRLSLSKPGFAEAVRLRLMGNVAGWVSDAAVATIGQDHVSIDGLLPHREALRRAAGSAVLLGITTAAEAGGVGLTSKLFEYLGLRRPVLMLAPPGPARALVEDLDAGWTAAPDEADGIERAIAGLFDDWRSGNERMASPDRLELLTRRMTAGNVARALDASQVGRPLN